jgi:hypothetical protein
MGFRVMLRAGFLGGGEPVPSSSSLAPGSNQPELGLGCLRLNGPGIQMSHFPGQWRGWLLVRGAVLQSQPPLRDITNRLTPATDGRRIIALEASKDGVGCPASRKRALEGALRSAEGPTVSYDIWRVVSPDD